MRCHGCVIYAEVGLDRPSGVGASNLDSCSRRLGSDSDNLGNNIHGRMAGGCLVRVSAVA